MPTHVKHGGTWKDGEIYAKHGGAWKRGELWVKQAGTWKLGDEVVVHVLSPANSVASAANPDYSVGILSSLTGGTVTSRTWGLISPFGGSWSISGSGSSVTLNINLAEPFTEASVTIYCDAVVDGITYRAQTLATYTNTSF